MCALRVVPDAYAATHHSHSYGFSPRCTDDRCVLRLLTEEKAASQWLQACGLSPRCTADT